MLTTFLPIAQPGTSRQVINKILPARFTQMRCLYIILQSYNFIKIRNYYTINYRRCLVLIVIVVKKFFNLFRLYKIFLLTGEFDSNFIELIHLSQTLYPNLWFPGNVHKNSNDKFSIRHCCIVKNFLSSQNAVKVNT